jgi:hypothetical protein
MPIIKNYDFLAYANTVSNRVRFLANLLHKATYLSMYEKYRTVYTVEYGTRYVLLRSALVFLAVINVSFTQHWVTATNTALPVL